MSETVKLVIEIPSEVYEHIKGHTDNWIDFMFLSRDGKAISAVKYGTLLDSDYDKLMTINQQLAFENEELRENIEKAKAEIAHSTRLHIGKVGFVTTEEAIEILDNIGNEKSPRT